MRIGAAEDVCGELKPGLRVILQGAAGEPTILAETLRASGQSFDIDLWSCLVPGINTTDYGALPGVRFTTFMASPALEASTAAGGTTVRDLPYSEIGKLIEASAFDLAILHTAPADEAGLCSFGVSADIGALAWPRARRRIVYFNRQMPRMPQGDAIPVSAIDLAIPIDAPLLAAPKEPHSPALDAIGRLTAQLVPDGAAIQSGVGRAPGAAIMALASRRNLTVHSGLITPDYRALAEAGALAPGGRHIAGIGWGDRDFYRWLAEDGRFAFRSIQQTHYAEALARPNFFSINSALETALDGSLNLEWRRGRKISSVGGAPDYARAAHASAGGRSIVVMPATASSGASRIVASLERPSLPGELIDTVVTEHGRADLRGKTLRQRAEAMIAIAAPEHRAGLANAQAGRPC